MKILMLGLLLASSVSFASEKGIIFPHVYNWGNRVEVQVHNNTDRFVWCSGSVYMTLESGKSESHYYSDYIGRGMFSVRSFYSRDLNDRIRNVHHGIFCN